MPACAKKFWPLVKACPIGNCLVKGVIYKAEVSGSYLETETYTGLTSRSFKERYYGHTSSFNHRDSSSSTTLSKGSDYLEVLYLHEKIIWGYLSVIFFMNFFEFTLSVGDPLDVILAGTKLLASPIKPTQESNRVSNPNQLHASACGCFNFNTWSCRKYYLTILYSTGLANLTTYNNIGIVTLKYFNIFYHMNYHFNYFNLHEYILHDLR